MLLPFDGEIKMYILGGVDNFYAVLLSIYCKCYMPNLTEKFVNNSYSPNNLWPTFCGHGVELCIEISRLENTSKNRPSGILCDGGATFVKPVQGADSDAVVRGRLQLTRKNYGTAERFGKSAAARSYAQSIFYKRSISSTDKLTAR